MIKKCMLMLLIAAMTAGVAAAFDFRAGAGLMLGGDSGGGVTMKSSFAEAGNNMPYLGTGFYFLGDMKYLETNIGFYTPTSSRVIKSKPKIPGFDESTDYNYSMLTLGLMAKLPLTLNKVITIFPLAGIDYRMVSKSVSGSTKEKDPEKLNALWFQAGGGLDISLPAKLFFRFEALYGIRFVNELENELKGKYKTLMPGFDIDTILGQGTMMKLAVGYKF